MRRCFDHIDLRVRRLADVEGFYTKLLPAIGFTQPAGVEGWLTFQRGDGDITEFFGITESTNHAANEVRVAFWAESNDEVRRIAEVARMAGARNMEGPMDYDPGYYAVFFEDPDGNRLEVCHRVKV